VNFAESFSQAFQSLKNNKLRSILTMLGIIFGVFSIIAIVALGNATGSYVSSQLNSVGANTITIAYKDISNTPLSQRLYIEDMQILTDKIPEIKNVASSIQRYGSLRIGEKVKDTVFTGVTSQIKNFGIFEMAKGRFINSFDISAKSSVVVINESFAIKYFNKTDILGEFVVLKQYGKTMKLKIVGVLKSSDDLFSSIMDNENVPAFAYMPITTLQSFYWNYKPLDNIMFLVEDDDKVNIAADKAINLLESKKGKKNLFYVQTSADIQKAANSAISAVSGVLLAVALITLVVGGIGIVNILLVSVTERIREIGIRKALGARGRDIIFQFLTESILLTCIGGGIGIAFGVIGGNVIAKVIKIPPVVDIPVIIMAFLGSVALGLIFGVYPAKKAAQLDPIESLRYE
jgi:putative ABC transport system permease protein